MTGSVFDAYRLNGLPTSFFIGPEGAIRSIVRPPHGGRRPGPGRGAACFRSGAVGLVGAIPCLAEPLTGRHAPKPDARRPADRQVVSGR